MNKVLRAAKKKFKGKLSKRQRNKVSFVMREGYAGRLRSGSKHGPVVTNPKQMLAIAYSEARKRA
jgi:hypothetical protein